MLTNKVYGHFRANGGLESALVMFSLLTMSLSCPRCRNKYTFKYSFVVANYIKVFPNPHHIYVCVYVRLIYALCRVQSRLELTWQKIIGLSMMYKYCTYLNTLVHIVLAYKFVLVCGSVLEQLYTNV